jgi:RNA polymerase sigma-70 factor (ECF subfamily)
MDPAELADTLPTALPSLMRYARTVTRDPVAAEDLVQETVVRALERADGFRGDASLTTWLHRILHNLAVDAARRRREVPSDDVAERLEGQWREDAYTVDAAAVAARAEDREELLDALSHLPFDQRTAVVLHDAEGFTAREVAEIQGVGLPAAKQRLRRGRMLLVSQLALGHERRDALRGVPLRCWEARRHVSEYLDGDLTADVAQRVERHLEACPTCPPLYAGLVATTDALRSAGEDGRAHDAGGRDPDSVVPPAVQRRLGDVTKRRDAARDPED